MPIGSHNVCQTLQQRQDFCCHRICWRHCYYLKPWRKDQSDKAIALKEFEMKDLGHLKYFLRMEVTRSNSWIFISQRNYVLDLWMFWCKPVDTSMDPNIKIGKKEYSPTIDNRRYQRLVGKLISISHKTWHWICCKRHKPVHDQSNRRTNRRCLSGIEVSKRVTWKGAMLSQNHHKEHAVI